MNSALIIFVRNPVLGKVKTRIAKDLGDKTALEVYKKLLAHTRIITRDLNADLFVFYADYITPNDLWENEVYKKDLQSGNDLGERMKNAFEKLFSKGYRKIAIIGSDCYELTKLIIEDALNCLDNDQVVIGPAIDGGYYLLGLNSFLPILFDNKQWSTESVFKDTINNIKQAGCSFQLLPVLHDTDDGEDCKRYSDLLYPIS